MSQKKQVKNKKGEKLKAAIICLIFFGLIFFGLLISGSASAGMVSSKTVKFNVTYENQAISGNKVIIEHRENYSNEVCIKGQCKYFIFPNCLDSATSKADPCLDGFSFDVAYITDGQTIKYKNDQAYQLKSGEVLFNVNLLKNGKMQISAEGASPLSTVNELRYDIKQESWRINDFSWLVIFWVLTILFEVGIWALVIKFKALPWRILWAVFIVNLVSYPLLFISSIFTQGINSGLLMLILLEIGVFIFETMLICLWMRRYIRFWSAVLYCLVSNVITVLLGFLLVYFIL